MSLMSGVGNLCVGDNKTVANHTKKIEAVINNGQLMNKTVE
jgi:hypothetical protein